MISRLPANDVIAASVDVGSLKLDDLVRDLDHRQWPAHEDGRLQVAAALEAWEIEGFGWLRWGHECCARGVALRVLMLSQRLPSWFSRPATKLAKTTIEYLETMGHDVNCIDGACFTLVLNDNDD